MMENPVTPRLSSLSGRFDGAVEREAAAVVEVGYAQAAREVPLEVAIRRC